MTNSFRQIGRYREGRGTAAHRAGLVGCALGGLLGTAFATGCGEPSRPGLMFYRPPPKSPARATAFKVGRYGRAAEMGVGGVVSDASNSGEQAATYRSFGRSMDVRSDSRGERAADPAEELILSRRYRESASRLSTWGESAVIGESGERAAQYKVDRE